VTDPESVPEPLAVSVAEVEKIVLVAIADVMKDPSLLVKLEKISVVEMGITTPPPVPFAPPERVVVATVVVTAEPSLLVKVERISEVVAETETPLLGITVAPEMKTVVLIVDV
jgi:hypothetical protein